MNQPPNPPPPPDGPPPGQPPQPPLSPEAQQAQWQWQRQQLDAAEYNPLKRKPIGALGIILIIFGVLGAIAILIFGACLFSLNNSHF